MRAPGKDTGARDVFQEPSVTDWQAELRAAERAVAAMTPPAADEYLEATAAFGNRDGVVK